MIKPRKTPLYLKLLRLHNNVRIASNLFFTIHDVIHSLLRNKFSNVKFLEKIGCIEIMDSVRIGPN